MSKKQRLCKICHKRPVWFYKNNKDNVCKRCYHKYVWVKPEKKQCDSEQEYISNDSVFNEWFIEDNEH